MVFEAFRTETWEDLSSDEESRIAIALAHCARVEPTDKKRLLEALGDGEVFRQRTAIKAIGEIASHMPEALPLLVNLFRDKASRVVGSAMIAAGMIVSAHPDLQPVLDSVLPEVLRCMESGDWDARVGALSMLAVMSDLPLAVGPVLLSAAANGSTADFNQATTILGGMGTRAIPLLEDALRHDTGARVMIEKEKVIPELLSMLAGEDDGLRNLAIRKLGLMGNEAVLAVDPFISHERSEVREAVARILGGTGPAAQATIPRLLELARDDSPAVRKAVLKALIQIAPESVEVFDCIDAALRDGEPFVRRTAVWSVGMLDSSFDKVAEILGKALKNEDMTVRQAAIKELGKSSASSNQATLLLCGPLGDQNEAVRHNAALVLSEMESTALIAEPALISLLDDESPKIRAIAVRALGRISDLSIESLPSIMKCLRDMHSGVRREAVEALGRAGANYFIALVSGDLLERA